MPKSRPVYTIWRHTNLTCDAPKRGTDLNLLKQGIGAYFRFPISCQQVDMWQDGVYTSLQT